MKQLHKSFCLILTLFAISVTGCGKEVEPTECPFTSIEWDADLDEITALEGDYLETYDSAYNGKTYTYDKEYEGLDGFIKYIFDDKEKLVGIAWTYISDDADDVRSVYDQLHTQAEEELGKSGFNFGDRKGELNSTLQENQDKLNEMGMSTPMTDVWYLEGGNVTLVGMITNDAKAVQYTYLHPDVSPEDPEK